MKQFAKSSCLRLTKAAALTIALASATVPAAHAAKYIYTGYNSTIPAQSFSPTGVFNFGSPTDTVIGSAQLGLILQGTAATQAGNFAQMQAFIQTEYTPAGVSSPAVVNDVNGVLSVMAYDNSVLNYTQWMGKAALDTLGDMNFNQALLRVSYLGDMDGNGTVDSLDFNLEGIYQSGALPLQGDLNGDGITDSLDFNLIGIVQSAIPGAGYGNLGDGQTLPYTGFADDGGSSPAAAPEPASIGLLLSGAAGLLGLRRRKSTASTTCQQLS